MTSHVSADRGAPAPRRGVVAAGPVAAVGGLAYLGTHDPHVTGSYPQCVLYSLTGIYCPACGGTRAAYDLMHGDVAGPSPATRPCRCCSSRCSSGSATASRYRRRHGSAAPAVPAWVPVGIAVAALVFGVLRNVPGWDWLSPA